MAKKEKKELNIDMTNQEKRAFAETVLGFAGNMIKFNQKTIRSNIISTIIMTPSIFGIVWWIGINPIYFTPFLLVASVGMAVLTHIAAVRSINKILKRSSNGKIKYRQYKQLMKSGELESWLKLDGSATAQTTQQTTNTQTSVDQTAEAQQTQNATLVQNNQGVSLTSEELALLQKLIGKKVVDVVINTQQTNQPTQPEANKDAVNIPADSGRNS